MNKPLLLKKGYDAIQNMISKSNKTKREYNP